MAVAIDELLDTLKRSVNPPGTDLFPNATDDEYIGYLTDAFWDARIMGLLDGWTLTVAEEIEPQSGSEDITRDLMQIIVIFAGINIITNELRNLDALFRAKAGPVEFETQKSASILKALLEELQQRRAIVMKRLGDLGVTVDYYIDGVEQRTDSLDYGEVYYTG